MANKQPATSAGRLKDLLSKLLAINGNTPSLDGWSSVLGVPAHDVIQLVPLIFEVGKLPDIVAVDMKKTMNRDVSVYRSWVSSVKEPFRTFKNFGTNVTHFTQHIDQNIISLLAICDDLLSNAVSEDVLVEKQRSDAINQLRKAYAAVMQDEQLDPYVKRYIIRYIDLAERALVEYQVFGISRAQEGIETIVGIASVSQIGEPELTKTVPSQVAIDALKKAALCVQTAQSAQWLLTEGKKAAGWLVENASDLIS